MKYLILSDIHGDYNKYQQVIKKHPDIKNIIISGDIVLKQKQYLHDNVFAVRGNCDCDFSLPLELKLSINKIDVLVTHGHQFGVKNNLDALHRYAKHLNVGMVIYGHTHIKHLALIDNIYYINPGSLRDNNTYVILDEKGVNLCQL